jgi:hypothetical protein
MQIIKTTVTLVAAPAAVFFKSGCAVLTISENDKAYPERVTTRISASKLMTTARVMLADHKKLCFVGMFPLIKINYLLLLPFPFHLGAKKQSDKITPM